MDRPQETGSMKGSEQTKVVSISTKKEEIAQPSSPNPCRLLMNKEVTMAEEHDCKPPRKSPSDATLFSHPNTIICAEQTKLVPTPMIMNDAEAVQQSPSTPLSFFMEKVLMAGHEGGASCTMMMAGHEEGASCTMMILVVEDNCSRLSEESSPRVQSSVYVSYRWKTGALPDCKRPLRRRASMDEDSSTLSTMPDGDLLLVVVQEAPEEVGCLGAHDILSTPCSSREAEHPTTLQCT
jgi:hypothetical protein